MRLNREKIQLFVLVQVVLVGVLRGHVAPTRVRRGIFGTVTSTLVKVVEERHYVPASCVHMAPNLPECRHAKFLRPDIDQFKFFNFGNELFSAQERSDAAIINGGGSENVNTTESSIIPTTFSWGEYFGFYRPTVTVTKLEIHPTTVLDPRIMVTYDIRGCKPQKLPFDLEKCVDDSSLEMAEIIPTTTVRNEIKPTELPEFINKGPEDVYGSETEREHENLHEATRKLTF